MKSKMGFKTYKTGTRVMIKSTCEHGEIWEVLENMNVCSVFVDGERKCRYFSLDDIIFLNQES